MSLRARVWEHDCHDGEMRLYLWPAVSLAVHKCYRYYRGPVIGKLLSEQNIIAMAFLLSSQQ